MQNILQNRWGNTTGKHLNWINPNKQIRINQEEFSKKLEEFLE